eukprot:4103651-Prymnesium_polylepis.1
MRRSTRCSCCVVVSRARLSLWITAADEATLRHPDQNLIFCLLHAMLSAALVTALLSPSLLISAPLLTPHAPRAAVRLDAAVVEDAPVSDAAPEAEEAAPPP